MAEPIGWLQQYEAGELDNQLKRQQISDYQALAGLRQTEAQGKQLEMAKQQQALEMQAADTKFMQDRQAGRQQAPAGAPAGQPGQQGGSLPLDQASGFMSDQMALIDRMASTGRMTQAGEMFSKLSTGFDNLSKAQTQQVEQRAKALDANIKQLGETNTLVGQIKDAGSFDRMKLQMVGAGLQLPPWMMGTYDQAKPFISDIQSKSKEALAAKETEAKTLAEKARASQEAAQTRLNIAKARIEEMTLTAEKERADLAKKNGEPTPIPGKGGAAAGTKGAQNERMRAESISGATAELARSLNIIGDMDFKTSGGLFGSKAANKGFFDAPLNTAATLATTQDQRLYNVSASNIGQAIAIIESGGLKPNQAQIENYTNKFRWQQGDTAYTKAFTMADAIAQAEERYNVTRTNPSFPQETKEHVDEILKKLKEKFPLTPEEMVQAKNKGKTIRQFMEDKKKETGGSPTKTSSGVSVSNW